ncbi:DUF6176 family protein [Weissella viridescens]|uniref:DUF6176 family protein n=2 Tax=Weissella TaxID=46255 RepID=UPI001D0766E3|nr:DUF6176 family protein [Weissella viridescens]MCB6839587.1 DUF6176 family protein [Weissella viridescens]MCB6846318.1 DUF6176 family protein [Weissella viridescens]
MHTELTKFYIRPGKEARVHDWMSFLSEHLSEVSLTLPAEHIFIESVFYEEQAEKPCLYWFTVETNGGRDVEKSPDWIDKEHIAYWNECIDNSREPINLTALMTCFAPRVKENMSTQPNLKHSVHIND